MCTKSGWYSSKYDSTRQRSLILSNTENYKKYTVSIRLEMLLAGTLVVTDAQWYDGLYFSKMIQNNEFFDFIDFASKKTNIEQLPFHIRRRSSIVDMFLKPFWFSSIENEELQSFLYSLYDTDIFDKYKDKDSNEKLDFDKYFNLLEVKIEQSKYNLKDAFENFKHRFFILHNDTPDNLFLEWGPHQYIPEDMPRAKKELDVLLKKSCSQNNLSKIDYIKSLLENNVPNRSKIKNSVNELTNMPKINDISFAEYFMAVFDSYYNFAIAKQHECRFYDLYDDFAISKNSNMPSYMYYRLDKTTLPELLFNGLEMLTWEEFGKVYYNKDIKNKRTEWQDSFECKNSENIQKKLSEYINIVIQKIYEIKPTIINNSVFYKATGSKRFVNIEMDNDGNVINGVNSDEYKNSKNFYFFSNNITENLSNNQIVRFATTNSDIEIFDTIFAPIDYIIAERENNAPH